MPVKVKICGLTHLSDAQAAYDAGADLLGFIFYPPSPRFITPELARQIVAGLRRGARPVLCVGVFVNAPLAEMLQVLDFCGLDLAQLHGEEPPEVLAPPLAGRAYKALRPQSAEDALIQAQRYTQAASVYEPPARPALLIDAYHPALRGGTGQTGDWQIAAQLAQRCPLLLAGGLTPANVRQAILQVRPWGIDISSGVESAPGQKDHAAIQALIRAAQSAPEPVSSKRTLS